MNLFKIEPWEWWVLGGLVITWYLIKSIRKKNKLKKQALEASRDNGTSDQKDNPGCFPTLLTWLLFGPEIRQLERDLNSPEMKEAERKAHDAMVELKAVVDELTEERERISEEKFIKQMDWFKTTYIDSGKLEALEHKSNKRNKATKTANPIIRSPKPKATTRH
jgi:hypothetical protein